MCTERGALDGVAEIHKPLKAKQRRKKHEKTHPTQGKVPDRIPLEQKILKRNVAVTFTLSDNPLQQLGLCSERGDSSPERTCPKPSWSALCHQKATLTDVAKRKTNHCDPD